MSRTLLAFLWRRHRLSSLLCGVIPVLIGVVVGLIYPTYSRERELLKAFKFSAEYLGGEQMDLFSPSGSFSLPFQHPLVLIAYAVIVAIPAMGLPAGERSRGALDLLLASPLTRRRMMLTVGSFQALLAPYLAACAFLGAIIGANLAGAEDGVRWAPYFLIALDAVGLTFFFSAVALLVSVLARDRASATLTYGIVVFVAFLIDVASRLWRQGGDWLAKLTPYGYLRPAAILGDSSGGEALRSAAVLVVAGCLIHALAIFVQERRRSA